MMDRTDELGLQKRDTSHVGWRIFWVTCFIVLALLIGGASWFYAYGEQYYSASVVLPEDDDRAAIAQRIGDALHWSPQQEQRFEETVARIQWQEYRGDVRAYLSEAYEWREGEKELFEDEQLQGSEYDVLKALYVPGRYELAYDAPVGEVARTVLDRIHERASSSPQFIVNAIDTDIADQLAADLTRRAERLPDIVPLPPQDVSIRKEGGRNLLVFTTVYYNQGDGPLELVADPDTAGAQGDIDRDVFQYIQRIDDETREEVVGTFEWHEQHLHYHFSDFIDYRLDHVDVKHDMEDPTWLQKTTFCVRDISEVKIENPYKPDDAEFKICGKERQGISVGWGDAYFHDYPDQNVDVTGLEAGTYRLTFEANPEHTFFEADRANNTSSALLKLDPAAGTVKVLQTTPDEFPDFEHVYPEQPFGEEPVVKETTVDPESPWDTDVACLPDDHADLALHIHPTLSVTVDGEQERVPENIGITAGCMAEVHTHGAGGHLHVEVAERKRIDELTLENFFAIWGKDVERAGYELTARVNGEEIKNPGEVTFEDNQEIELEYTSM